MSARSRRLRRTPLLLLLLLLLLLVVCAHDSFDVELFRCTLLRCEYGGERPDDFFVAGRAREVLSVRWVFGEEFGQSEGESGEVVQKRKGGREEGRGEK